MRVKKYEWSNNYLSDNETLDLFEFENINLEVAPDGRLLATGAVNKDLYWPVNGFISYLKDFADFKVDTLAK